MLFMAKRNNPSRKQAIKALKNVIDDFAKRVASLSRPIQRIFC